MLDYDKLDAVLREKHISRRAAAIGSGIGQSKMSMWFVRKTKNVPYRHIKSLAAFLGVPAGEITDTPDELISKALVLNWLESLIEAIKDEP